jgi:hypothetical protein
LVQLQAVFLLVSGDGAQHLGFEVGMQQVGFFLVELAERAVGLEVTKFL